MLNSQKYSTRIDRDLSTAEICDKYNITPRRARKPERPQLRTEYNGPCDGCDYEGNTGWYWLERKGRLYCAGCWEDMK